MYGSASHGRRQSDVYRSIKTLDQLTEQLKKDGFTISRSGLYLRLLPKRSSSSEGQRHVTTVPVKLIRAQNDHHAWWPGREPKIPKKCSKISQFRHLWTLSIIFW